LEIAKGHCSPGPLLAGPTRRIGELTPHGSTGRAKPNSGERWPAAVGIETLERHDRVETRFRGSGEDGSSPIGLSTVALEGGWESASVGQIAGRGS
jgi:hypothetical protein